MSFSRALLIGINYIGTSYTLKGCHNDVENVKKLLMVSGGLKEDQITVLKEPKRLDILRAFVKFVMVATQGESLYFHYSGHGTQVKDTSEDETDGKDEVIVASDLKGISDDEIKRYLIGCLPSGVDLFTVFDCCHSGTIVDLGYLIRYNNNKEGSGSQEFKISKDTKGNNDRVGGKVVSLSGSLDEQYATDAFLKNTYQGALTYCLIETINENENYKFGPMMDFLIILENVNKKLKSYGFVNQESILSLNKI
jgi:hypothetical protein